jgi:hypothetical protein
MAEIQLFHKSGEIAFIPGTKGAEKLSGSGPLAYLMIRLG